MGRSRREENEKWGIHTYVLCAMRYRGEGAEEENSEEWMGGYCYHE